MKIHAMSRARALHLRPGRTCAMISISTPRKEYPSPVRDAGWLEFLALTFDDVANTVPAEGDPYLRFSPAMARQVMTLADDSLKRGCEDLIIHCDAGQSRSVAIAAALAHAGFGDALLWDAANELGANDLVTRTLRASYAAGPAPEPVAPAFGGLTFD